jgi:ABC-type transport system involved in multi-copper enzyme maturation permease subunit
LGVPLASDTAVAPALRTVAATGWLLAGVVVLTVVLGALVALAVSYSSTGSGQDITKLSLTGVYLGQVIVAILAVLSISGEYSSGMGVLAAWAAAALLAGGFSLRLRDA